MAAKTTQKGKIAQEMLLKFPKTSKSALAEMLVENYPTLFSDKEVARTLLRSYTMPSSKKKNKIDRGGEDSFEAIMDRYSSKSNERVFVKIPQQYNNVLWLSDIHFPNQDNKAVSLALDYGKKNKVNCIVLGGDILDNEPFTNHDAPPPSKNDVVDWFDMVEEFIEMLRNKFKGAKIYWLEGNHCNWYKRYLMKKAPMLFNDEYYDLRNRLNLKKYDVCFLEQHIVLKAGKLQMLHGHTISRGFIAPVNAARGVFLKAKCSTLIGHVHQTSEHSESNLKGEIVACYSVGCLCTLSPQYDPHNTKHNKGFAHIQIESNGDYVVHNKRIINNKIY